jgi:Flp pilus assembly protein TadG
MSKKIVSKLLNFIRSTDGNMAIIFTLAMVPVIGAAGVAIDYSYLAKVSKDAQNALDSAVLAGVKVSGSDSDKIKAAADHYYSNLDINVNSNAPTFVISASGNRIDGTATVTASRTLTSIFSSTPLSSLVESRAILGASSNNYRCLHALNSSTSDALIYNNKRGPLAFVGNSIIAPQCDVQVNSGSSNAVYVKEDIGYEFEKHCFVGGIRGKGNSIIPAPDSTCKTSLPDPLGAMSLPSASSNCTGTVSSGSHTVLNPGTFCNDISISANHITLKPGVYHMTGGDINLRASDQIIGNDVTIIMHPGSGSIEMLSDAELTLSAPVSGATAGFLIMDRNSNPQDHLLKTKQNDVAWMSLDGIIYTPEDHFELFWKRAGVGINEKPLTFRNFGLIADTIDLHGYNQLFIETPDLSAMPPELLSNGGNNGIARLAK